MVAINRFSKACKLISLKGLPTALEKATTLFHHVFRNYALYEDIVSIRGPQFTSRVWRAFCEKLGINKSPPMSQLWMTGPGLVKKFGNKLTSRLIEPAVSTPLTRSDPFLTKCYQFYPGHGHNESRQEYALNEKASR
ncbi:hypothetical protein QTP70_007173 [Hemibagrus guttatus]|uniref:Integrase catalytic domain-containing protein n=1 Tax=Hemibagrus guttatus TaxID=175788 RepID=A0AAE0QDA4_9TELE|nr:hypothetical protein QTP70_007173 [Hemibagrus guttatus]